MNILRSIWHTLYDMKESILLGIVVAVIGMYSLGVLGGVLYYACYPLVVPFYGEISDWSNSNGDALGALIEAGMRGGISFPVAGYVNIWLRRFNVKILPRLLWGLVIVWIGGALAWHYTILIRPGFS